MKVTNLSAEATELVKTIKENIQNTENLISFTFNHIDNIQINKDKEVKEIRKAFEELISNKQDESERLKQLNEKLSSISSIVFTPKLINPKSEKSLQESFSEIQRTMMVSRSITEPRKKRTLKKGSLRKF